MCVCARAHFLWGTLLHCSGVLEDLASNSERRSPLIESLCRSGPETCAKLIKHLEEYDWADDNTPAPDPAAIELNMGVRIPMVIDYETARTCSRDGLKEILKLLDAQIQVCACFLYRFVCTDAFSFPSPALA